MSDSFTQNYLKKKRKATEDQDTSQGDSGYDSGGDDFVDQFLQRKRQENEANRQREEQQRQTAQAVVEAKKEPEKRKRSFFESVGDRFEANSPEDKEKRKAQGLPEDHDEANRFKKSEEERKKNLNFTEDEKNMRRDYYKRQGVDLDKVIDFKNRFGDVMNKDLKAKDRDWKAIAEQAKNEGLFDGKEDASKDLEAAYQFEKQGSKVTPAFFRQSVAKAISEYDPKKIEKIENDFKDFEGSIDVNNPITEQIDRNFSRGLIEPIVKFPGSARTMASGALDLLSPEGSRVDKFAQGQYEAGKQDLKDVDQKFIDQGIGQNPNDNRVVAGISSGAGSLASALATAGISSTGKTSQAVGWFQKAKAALNPGVTGTIYGTNAGAEQYIGAIDSGKSDFQAFATAIVGGAAEGYLEKLGLDKYMGASGSTVKKFFTRALSEGGQEFSQSLAQSGVKSTYTDVDMSQALLQALEEGGYGAIVGGGGDVVISLTESMTSKGVPEDVAKQTAEKVAKKLEEIGKDELPKQDGSDVPDSGDAIVKALQDGTPVDDTLPTDGDLIVQALQDETPADQGTATATDVPDDGDAIVKALQDESPTPTQAIAPADLGGELPTDGDAIVKALQDEAPVVERPKGSLKPISKKVDAPKTESISTAKTEKIDEPKEGYTRYKVEVDGQTIYADYNPKGYINKNPHIEFHGEKNNPVSETGYKSFFPNNTVDETNIQSALQDLATQFALENKTYQASRKKGSMKPIGKKPDYEVYYPEGKDLPQNLRDRVPMNFEESAKTGKEVLKSDNKLTSREVEIVTGRTVSWNRTQLKDLIKYSKDLKENPVLTVVKQNRDTRYSNGGSNLAIEYKSKDGSQMFRLPIEEIGFNTERINSSGIKAGDTISIDKVVLAKGKVPVLRNTKTGVDYAKTNPNSRMNEITKDESSKSEKIHNTTRSKEDLIKLAQDLNKAGQVNSILRKGGSKSKKALGSFQYSKNKGDEKINLQDAVIADPAQYVSTLAHELSHAIEWVVNGDTKNTYKLFGVLSAEEKTQIDNELKAIVVELEGEAAVMADPKYFNRPTEQLARYVQMLLLDKAKAVELAPTVTEKYDEAVQRHPEMKELVDALNGEIDKGFRNKTMNWYRDLRQTYQKTLGKRAGDNAYNAELVRRAKIQHWQKSVGKLIKEKFKNVKDDTALLFRTAEAIKQTDSDGNLVYGTRDFQEAKTPQEIKDLKDAGYEFVKVKIDKDLKETAIFARQRYTEEEGQAMFDSLSPEGQQLIRDFVATKEQAKDFFNREVIKDVFKIESELEGWVHRGLRNEETLKDRIKGRMSMSKKGSLNKKTAGIKKQRGGSENHLEDFKKQMEKALVEAGDADINNAFILKQLARISKPIAKGQLPDSGWVEITADFRNGLKLPGEASRDKVHIEKIDDMTGQEVSVTFLKPQTRYQVPKELAQHYRNIREIPEDMSRMKKIMMGINKYWAINVLLHGGTVGTNFIGGGLQYSAKVLSDFYAEVLSGNVTLPQTRRNVGAIVQVLLPHGWSNAPDYIYGGHRSNYAGQFMNQSSAEKMIDKAGNVLLTPFSTVESYWKKVIMLSENAQKLGKKELEKEMVEFSKEEEAMIASINEAVDLYAFDYDNVPNWLESWGRKGGGLIKPFMKYPYKYSKLITNLASGAFDRTLPANERAAKLLTLTTMMAISMALMGWRDEEKETPSGTEKTPSPLDPRGRLFLWKNGDDEMFVRTAKYPFVNIASTARALLNKDWEEASNVVNDQLGTVGFGGKTILTVLGYTNKYEQYTPKDAMIGQQVATLIPGFRILNDIGKMMDNTPRRPENFVQGVFSNLPVWGSEETKTNFRGDARTVKVPDEPDSRSISESSTTEKELKLYNSDIILSALTGIYITRIKPEDAKQQQLREQRNAAEEQIRALLTDGKEDEARKKADEVGLTIPKGTYDYYRRKRSKN